MTIKQNIIIKGTKDGLMFLLNDDCPFDEVIDELKEKLETSHQTILSGPVTRVTIKTGFRQLSAFQVEELKNVISTRGNLMIQSIEHEEIKPQTIKEDNVEIVTGTIRSGQVQTIEGNVLFIGDVNPGGILMASGDIYVLGALRGIAHAGINGNKEAIIAASKMDPTQIRIAEILSRPAEEALVRTTKQEFAHIKDGRIFIDKVQNLSKLRKELAIL